MLIKNTFEVIENNKIFVKEKKDQVKLTAKISLGVIEAIAFNYTFKGMMEEKQNSLF